MRARSRTRNWNVKPEEPAYVIHSTSKVEAPRRRLALTLERGAYWRTPRRIRTPINGIRLSARAMDAEVFRERTRPSRHHHFLCFIRTTSVIAVMSQVGQPPI